MGAVAWENPAEHVLERESECDDARARPVNQRRESASQQHVALSDAHLYHCAPRHLSAAKLSVETRTRLVFSFNHTEPITLRAAAVADEPFLQDLYASTRQEELAQLDWSEAEKGQFLQMQF